MSDHETCIDDGWEEEDEATIYAKLGNAHQTTNHGRRPLHDQSNSRTFAGPAKGDPAGQNFSPRRPRTNGIPGRKTGVESRQARPARKQTVPAEEEQRTKQPPTRIYILWATWYTLLANVDADGITPAKAARLRLDEIAAATKTHIATPHLRSKNIGIWGSEEQAEAAYGLLRLWEREVRDNTRPLRPKHLGSETAGIDGHVEERGAVKPVDREAVKIQDVAFGESLDHGFELYLLWPQSIGLEDLVEDHSQTIREIEGAYDCRILCSRVHSLNQGHSLVQDHSQIQGNSRSQAHSIIQVSAQDESKVLQVQERLINIGREMIAKRNLVIRADFLRYPRPTTYKSGVQLIKDDRTGSFFPSLCGPAMTQDEMEEYQALLKGTNHTTRLKIRRHIERGLTGHLQLSSKHVRMRVTFLELAFLQYKRPSGKKPYHDFSDYVDMIGDERTKLQAHGLRRTGNDPSQLVEKFTQRLGQPELVYALHCDFEKGPTLKGRTLRFEWDLRPSHMEGEVESLAQRWVEHRSEIEDDLLLVNVLDFERPGCQVVIRALPFPSSQAIREDMDFFAKNVDFTTPPEGIKAPPQRKGKFPPGRLVVEQVAEMTIMRYRYKDQGLFEIRRRDTYLVNSAPQMIRTDWSACYYYPEWDNKMGMFGSLKPGQDVDFNRSVTTFFPVKKHEKAEAGLKRFTTEVDELQAILGVCIDELPVCELAQQSQGPSSPATNVRW